MNEERSLRLAVSVRPPLLARDSGPGLRWLLFLQGCRRQCTDQCLNPEYLNPSGGHLVGLSELCLIAGQVAAGTYGSVEGITLLGGEPSDQAQALAPFLEVVNATGLSVMLYSGHPIAWFHRPEHRAAGNLLGLVDILVDGPFVPSLAVPGLRWRGSSNQKIRRLTDRYSERDLAREQKRVGVTVTIPGSGLPVISGLQIRVDAAEIEARLKRQSQRSGRESSAAGTAESPVGESS